MKKMCNLYKSRFTYRDMRQVVIIGILSFFTSAAFAQGAADKDAINLSGKMDTVARGTGENQSEIDPVGNLNVGLKNSDQWEDFELTYVRLDPFSKLRFGGPTLFDTLNNPRISEDASAYVDLDGDGIGDIVSESFLNWFKGKKEYPYFDDAATGRFYYWRSTIGILGTIDYDRDGYVDLLLVASAQPLAYLELFKGGPTFNKGSFLKPDDTMYIAFPDTLKWASMTVGAFGKNKKPEIIIGISVHTRDSSFNSIGIIKNTTSLSKDSIVWLDNSTIFPANFYATDITGDGITDLIVSDNYHIYIFKGGDDFGTYPLTPENAYYTIKSPKLSDLSGEYIDVFNFGGLKNSIRACGDLTGSGIPYLMVTASSVNSAGGSKGYAFLYAGGKALDSLYDAVIESSSLGFGGFDTLHSINSTGRTAGLILDYQDRDDSLFNIDFLIFNNCDKIPHKTNPQWNTSVKENNTEIGLSSFPSIANKFEKIIINSPGFFRAKIEVFDLLGRKILERYSDIDAGDNTEYFNTTQFSEGTYIVHLSSEKIDRSTKFFIHH